MGVMISAAQYLPLSHVKGFQETRDRVAGNGNLQIVKDM